MKPVNCVEPQWLPKQSIYGSCGRCILCRKRQAYAWSQRLQDHEVHNGRPLFITLTYDSRNLPDGKTLLPEELQLYFKRLRKITKKKIQYLAVGEYGAENNRPHYHIILFGLSIKYKYLIWKAWGKCNPLVGYKCEYVRSAKAYHYLTGYITKKIQKYYNREKLITTGTWPEFLRASQGIGLQYAKEEILDNGLLPRWINRRRVQTIPHRYYRKKLGLDKSLYADVCIASDISVIDQYCVMYNIHPSDRSELIHHETRSYYPRPPPSAGIGSIRDTLLRGLSNTISRSALQKALSATKKLESSTRNKKDF